MGAPNNDKRRKCRNRLFLVLVVLHVPIHILPDMHMVLRNNRHSFPYLLHNSNCFGNMHVPCSWTCLTF
jgi:hypothetical protein